MRAGGDRDAFAVPHSQFWCDTEDGVRLSGTRLGEDRDTAVVLVHGFMGYRTKPKWRLLAEGLAEHYTVFTFDLRGHGQSQGACSGGEHEALDVRALVEHARARGFRRVVTVGGSLGGIAVVRSAALFGGGDAVAAISTPAMWGTSNTKAVRRAQWIFTTRIGRSLAGRIMGTRIHLDWGNPEAPAELVARIAPTPLLVVHGIDDHFFPPSDAEMLYARAGEPKRLLLLPDFGHAEDGFTPAFATTLAEQIDGLLAASQNR